MGVWRRVLGVGVPVALVVALWLAVLVGFPSFPGGGPHLPALGPSNPRPSPGALASPTPLPTGDASNPQAQAGPPGTGTRVIGGGIGRDEVEDEPPDVEDEPPTASGGGPAAALPSPAPGSVGQNVLPSATPRPGPSLPALPLPTPPVPAEQ